MAGKTSASRTCSRRTCAVSLAQGAKTDSVPVASRATQPPRAAGGGNKDGTAHHRAATLVLWSSHRRAKNRPHGADSLLPKNVVFCGTWSPPRCHPPGLWAAYSRSLARRPFMTNCLTGAPPPPTPRPTPVAARWRHGQNRGAAPAWCQHRSPTLPELSRLPFTFCHAIWTLQLQGARSWSVATRWHRSSSRCAHRATHVHPTLRPPQPSLDPVPTASAA